MPATRKATLDRPRGEPCRDRKRATEEQAGHDSPDRSDLTDRAGHQYRSVSTCDSPPRTLFASPPTQNISVSKPYFLPGWYSPGTKRNVIASRFHPLMVMIASVRFTNSSSEKLFLALSYSALGTWPSLTRVIASVSASAPPGEYTPV